MVCSQFFGMSVGLYLRLHGDRNGKESNREYDTVRTIPANPAPSHASGPRCYTYDLDTFVLSIAAAVWQLDTYIDNTGRRVLQAKHIPVA
jgi:hypothetical protein